MKLEGKFKSLNMLLKFEKTDNKMVKNSVDSMLKELERYTT